MEIKSCVIPEISTEPDCGCFQPYHRTVSAPNLAATSARSKPHTFSILRTGQMGTVPVYRLSMLCLIVEVRVSSLLHQFGDTQ